MRDKRVFISGGAGVIGSALVDMLYEMGAKLFVGDLKEKPLNWPQDIRYRKGDLNYISKEELLSFQPEYFFHLAATFERSEETYDFWSENYQHNIRLGHHLMDCIKECQSLKKVIFASSYLIYDPKLYTFSHPQSQAVRLREENQIYPRNLTGVAKLLHEIELRFLNNFKETHFENVSARIFRVYGRNSRDIVSRWVRSLLNNEEITIYRKEGIFDYIYADDVAEGLIKLAQSNITGIVNLGNDNSRSVSEVIDVLRSYFPSMISREIEMDSNIPYEASQANMDYFKKNINWTPQHQLETAIPKIIEFEKSNRNKVVKENQNQNILITSVSKKVALIKLVRSANEKFGGLGRIFGGDVDENCIGANFVDEFWHMPYLKELDIKTVIDYCLNNNIKFIIPTRDGELPYFAKYKKDFLENGIFVMVSDLEGIELTLDKYSFAKKLEEVGYPVIPTELNINDLLNESLVVKERFGAGSISIGLNLNRTEAEQHANSLITPVFQPFIKGEEFSVDIYSNSLGKAKGIIVRKREIVKNGESQVTFTIRNQKLEDLCVDLIENLKLFGHIVMQVIIDSNGGFHIIEINSRFGGASHLSIKAGLDSFYWFFLEASGQNIDDIPFNRTQKELKLIRYPEDLII